MKQAAYAKVAAALKNGELVKQPCEVCGSRDSEAHHDDYAKPLDVRWLCHKHHTEMHGEQRRGGGTVLARLAITPEEWAELRKVCIDLDKRPSQLLAELVRKYLKGRK